MSGAGKGKYGKAPVKNLYCGRGVQTGDCEKRIEVDTKNLDLEPKENGKSTENGNLWCIFVTHELQTIILPGHTKIINSLADVIF